MHIATMHAHDSTERGVSHLQPSVSDVQQVATRQRNSSHLILKDGTCSSSWALSVFTATLLLVDSMWYGMGKVMPYASAMEAFGSPACRDAQFSHNENSVSTGAPQKTCARDLRLIRAEHVNSDPGPANKALVLSAQLPPTVILVAVHAHDSCPRSRRESTAQIRRRRQ